MNRILSVAKPCVTLEPKGGEGDVLVGRSVTNTVALADKGVRYGWHHVESYVSHYFFLVTTDEEDDQGRWTVRQ